MEEIWKTIEDYPNYEVSTFGNIKNKTTNNILTPRKTSHGYLRINIQKNNKYKSFYVHRLVANIFIPNPENKPTVNHIDACTSNNNLINLEWATMSEQNKHKIKTNIQIGRHINNIWRIDINTYKKLEKYNSTTEAVKWLRLQNLTKRKNSKKIAETLSKVSKGVYNSAYGYKWMYEFNNHEIKDEKWKEIPFEIIGINNYYVSDHGRIKNNINICNLQPDITGYVKIQINKKSYLVHRLVALGFLPNLKNKKQVNHIDGNKNNNKLLNLEWSTNKENSIHKIQTGLSHCTKKIIQYDFIMNKIQEFMSITEASKCLNISTETISRNCYEKTTTTKSGFLFRFC